MYYVIFLYKCYAEMIRLLLFYKDLNFKCVVKDLPAN